jgi:hypothetical protein
VLLTCLVVMLWARSCNTQDYLMRQGNGWEIGLRSRWGLLYVQVGPGGGALPTTWILSHKSLNQSYTPVHETERRWGMLGFNCFQAAPTSSWVGTTFVTVPHWFLAMVPWLVPAMRWAYRRPRERRRRRGMCVACGYDLRGTPARCPECGRAADGDERERSADGPTAH